jgi:hypothetical protein
MTRSSSHSVASLEAARLCEGLFSELSKLISLLKKNPTQGSCGIWQDGKTRFAYVYHSKTRSQIEVWCRGDLEDLLANDPGLAVHARDNPGPGWERSFPARFRLTTYDQIPTAARYLQQVSYGASLSK